jgi:hypothetical protein
LVEGLRFGEDFYFGTYTIKNDTLYLDLEENVGFMDKSSYAVLIKSQTDTSSYRQMILHKNHSDNRSISFLIKEIEMDKLRNEKMVEK